MARMHGDTDTGRDRLDLLPREAWPEPWRSMDTGGPPWLPNDIPDPETDDRPRLVPVLVDLSHAPYIAALEQLSRHLRRLHSDYSALKAPTPQNKRLAAHLSLVVAIDLLRALPGGHKLGFALVDLMAAITDIEEGRHVDWLTPPPIGGRAAGVHHVVAAWRGRYACIVELLHRRQRMPIRNAAQAVQRAIPADDPVWGSGTPSWKAVKRWRDRDVKVDGSPEKTSFEAGLALAEKIPGADPMKILSCMRDAP